mgnify:FL=1
MAESCLRYFSHMGIFLTESVRVGIVKEKKLLYNFDKYSMFCQKNVRWRSYRRWLCVFDGCGNKEF